MAECIKTGALVYFPEYGTYSRGDLHKVGQTFVLYGNPPFEENVETLNVTHHLYLMDTGFHRPTEPYQVWITNYVSEV